MIPFTISLIIVSLLEYSKALCLFSDDVIDSTSILMLSLLLIILVLSNLPFLMLMSSHSLDIISDLLYSSLLVSSVP